MRKVVLYIAMSLDGYIADKDGGVTWLTGDGSGSESVDSYNDFIHTVDTVIMGYQTYHQIVTELSPDVWVYADKITYVMTHKQIENQENIIFTDDLQELVTMLKSKEGKNIWICGGAAIVNQLIDIDFIDEYCITIVPILLGNGIPLFEKHQREIKLKLLASQSYDGFMDLRYERR